MPSAATPAASVTIRPMAVAQPLSCACAYSANQARGCEPEVIVWLLVPQPTDPQP